jgi:hypothetical protein
MKLRQETYMVVTLNAGRDTANEDLGLLLGLVEHVTDTHG